ncbi:MAG TPA: CoA ester lyase [Methylomirabilota bacterium]|jgi:citrate lyase subunit beta/citryl-CoA lyase|nr:CoA ester lyase [Methylomirabilota bacterium]
MKLYRSILFVPGNRPDWIDKAPQYGPDALILDLEDAVPIPEKAAARSIVRAGIERSRQRGVPIVVRVNGLNTGLTGEDVEAVVTVGLVAIAIPKLERVEEVLKVDAWIELFERKAGLPPNSVEIIVLPETARGIMNIYQLATACPRVGNIVGGVGARSGDVTKAIGYKWTRPGLETLYMASHMLLAARAAGIEYPLCGGSLEVSDTELVRAQLQRAREIGFRGALLIHPSAVPIANEVFAPSKEEIEWNKGVLQAMYEAEQAGRAAVTYDGMMIDYAHVRNALDLLHQAEAFGLEVGEYPPIKAL